MTKNPEQTKRGFVMTGGGAKGLYEAGVIHAFHLCNMEFDVITGSSIGAINAAFYAEYLYQKRQLPPKIRANPDQTLEEMDGLIKQYHEIWQNLPNIGIVNDGEDSPLGKLKNDLLRFDLRLPQLIRLAWWWSDPNKKKWLLPAPRIWFTLLALIKEGVERFDKGVELFRIWGESKRTQREFKEVLLRAYLARFGLEHALVPDADGKKLVDAFKPLIDSKRTMRDYAKLGIDLRLTRANFRTGRLEISRYQSIQDFTAYLDNHAWHLEKIGDQVTPLGSSRLETVGDPNVINAAVASGRFPGVFTPFPLAEIYDLENTVHNPENAMLAKLVENWLDDPQIEQALYAEYKILHPRWSEPFRKKKWEENFRTWQESSVLRQLFPHKKDTYVDGGSIDNTPTNSAVDAMRQWSSRNDFSRRDLQLELYTVFLNPPKIPKIDPDEDLPALYEVVQRSLTLSHASKLPSDAVVVRTINTYGQRAEELGGNAKKMNEGIQAILKGLETELPTDLSDEQKTAVKVTIEALLAKGLDMPERSAIEIQKQLQKISKRTKKIMSNLLPIHVEPIEIYPDTMPMSTLQLTHRLGFRADNALQMLTVGCYNTLWCLRSHLENKAQEGELDEKDQRSLMLTRRWMDFEAWPPKSDDWKETWQCQRHQCAFYEHGCRHGRVQKMQ